MINSIQIEEVIKREAFNLTWLRRIKPVAAFFGFMDRWLASILSSQFAGTILLSQRMYLQISQSQMDRATAESVLKYVSPSIRRFEVIMNSLGPSNYLNHQTLKDNIVQAYRELHKCEVIAKRALFAGAPVNDIDKRLIELLNAQAQNNIKDQLNRNAG